MTVTNSAWSQTIRMQWLACCWDFEHQQIREQLHGHWPIIGHLNCCWFLWFNVICKVPETAHLFCRGQFDENFLHPLIENDLICTLIFELLHYSFGQTPEFFYIEVDPCPCPLLNQHWYEIIRIRVAHRSLSDFGNHHPEPSTL